MPIRAVLLAIVIIVAMAPGAAAQEAQVALDQQGRLMQIDAERVIPALVLGGAAAGGLIVGDRLVHATHFSLGQGNMIRLAPSLSARSAIMPRSSEEGCRARLVCLLLEASCALTTLLPGP